MVLQQAMRFLLNGSGMECSLHIEKANQTSAQFFLNVGQPLARAFRLPNFDDITADWSGDVDVTIDPTIILDSSEIAVDIPVDVVQQPLIDADLFPFRCDSRPKPPFGRNLEKAVLPFFSEISIPVWVNS